MGGILNGIALTLLKLKYIVLKQFQNTPPFVVTLKRMEQHNSFFVLQQDVKIWPGILICYLAHALACFSVSKYHFK